MDNKTQQRFMYKYATHDLDRQYKAKSIILAMDGKGVRLSKPLTFVIAPPDYLTLFTISFFIRNLLTAFLQGCPGVCWLSSRATRVKKVNLLSQGKEGLATGVANKDAPGTYGCQSLAFRHYAYWLQCHAPTRRKSSQSNIIGPRR